MKIKLSPEFYTISALEKSKIDFQEFLSFSFQYNEILLINIDVKKQYLSNDKKIIKSLLNYILDCSIQEKE